MMPLIIIGLTMLAAGGLVHVFVYPHLSGDIKAEKRQAAMRSPGPRYPAGRQTDAAAAYRRKQIAQTLQELGDKGKKKHSLETRIAQAGLFWNRSKFIAASSALAALLGALVWLAGVHLLVAGPAMIVGGFGLPAWLLSFLRKRRLKKFVEEFPNAIDIIIRGVKAGLPMFAHHRRRIRRAGSQRIPPDCRSASDRAFDERIRRAHCRPGAYR